jgi:hypothetical protein
LTIEFSKYGFNISACDLPIIAEANIITIAKYDTTNLCGEFMSNIILII